MTRDEARVGERETFAECLWAAEREVARLEDELGDTLDELFGESGWQDFQTDHYDRSIEVFGVVEPQLLPDNSRAKLAAEGFRKAWLHADPKERGKPGEHFYSLAATASQGHSRQGVG
jgi:hypothetical protein